LLKKTIVVTGRDELPTDAIRDKAVQFTTARQIVEVWIYQDRDKGWPFDVRDRVFTLLHEKPLPGTFGLVLVNNIKVRAVELGGACLLRSDYEVIASYGG
jgi:hypothetical protein